MKALATQNDYYRCTQNISSSRKYRKNKNILQFFRSLWEIANYGIMDE